jgi:hypothetical protein
LRAGGLSYYFWSDLREQQNCRGLIVNNGGTLTLNNSTVSGNTASGSNVLGGGILNQGALTITNSTISGNTVSGQGSDGGGIANGPNSMVTLTNSTISGNTSSSKGGGISNFGSQVDIEFCTIYGNEASDNGGGLSIEDGQDINGKTVPSAYSSNVFGNGHLKSSCSLLQSLLDLLTYRDADGCTYCDRHNAKTHKEGRSFEKTIWGAIQNVIERT